MWVDKTPTQVKDILGLGTTSSVTFDTISGTWNGDVIASAYLDSDTAHLSTAQTFTGAKQFDDDVVLFNTNSGATADPKLILRRDSSSPADGDLIGQIDFQGSHGMNTNGTTSFAQIIGEIDNVNWQGQLTGAIHFRILTPGNNIDNGEIFLIHSLGS